MGPIGFTEMIFIFVVALLVFGPKKLPELGKSFGKGVAEFRKASSELRATFQREMDTIEHETNEVKKVADDVRGNVTKSYHDYQADNESYDADHAPYEPSESSGPSDSTPASPPVSTVGETTSSAKDSAPAANGASTPSKSGEKDASSKINAG